MLMLNDAINMGILKGTNVRTIAYVINENRIIPGMLSVID